MNELERLYIQGYKPIDSRLQQPGKGMAKEKVEKSQADKIKAAEEKLKALLEASAESREAQQLVQQISQNIKKAVTQKPDEDIDEPLALTFERHPDEQKYRDLFDEQGYEKFQARYQNLLLYCKLAYLEEKNGIPEEHALKLALLFDSDKTALEYLSAYINQKYNLSVEAKGECKTEGEVQAKQDEKQRILYNFHNACLWGIPSPKCNWDAWRRLAKVNMMDVNFRQTLQIAEDLEEIINNNQLLEPAFDENITKEQINEMVSNLKEKIDAEEQESKGNLAKIKGLQKNKKIESEEKQKNIEAFEGKCEANRKSLLGLRQQRYDIKPRYDIELIKLKKKEIEKINTKLKVRVRRKDTRGLSSEEKITLTSTIAALANKLSTLKCELFKLSAGQPLEKLSIDELLAAEEFRQKQTFGELKSYLTDKGFTNKLINQFNLLERTDNDTLIPNISLTGHEKHSGIYLMKVPVLDTMQAARAAAFGRLTGCCQSLGDVGGDCVIHGLTSPNGGFYVVCKGDVKNPDVQDEVLGQCWAWRSEDSAIVFDSIESNNKNNVAVKELFNTLALKLIKDNHTDKVVCGATSGISSGMGVTPILNKSEIPRDYSKYRDSHNQRLIYDKTKPFYFYDMFETAKFETEKFIQESLKQNKPLSENIAFCSMLHLILVEQKNSLLELVANEATQNNKQAELEHILDKLRFYMKGEVTVGDVLLNPENSFLLVMPDNDGKTLLHKAIIDNDMENTGNILNGKHAELIINNTDNTGQSALHYAVATDNQNAIQLLIEKNANPNIKDSKHNTPLMLAIKNRNSKLAKWMLENIENINVDMDDEDGNHPIMEAISAGMLDIVNMLIDKKAIINEVNQRDETPLMLAVECGFVDIALKLIEKGADVNVKNKKGTTLLMRAAKGGYVEISSRLIEKGVNINETNDEGSTSLMWAIRSKHENFALKLIEKGADVSEKDNYDITALMLAVERGYVEVSLKLFENGVNINEENRRGSTPLMQTIRSGHEALALKLIEKGANINEKDKYGNTPLVEAIKGRRENLACILIEKGAAVNVKTRMGETPLILAIDSNYVNVALKLIEKDAAVNVRTIMGVIPLMLAVKRGHLGVALKLIEKGADINLKDEKGRTPLMLAPTRRLVKMMENKAAEFKEKSVRPSRANALRFSSAPPNTVVATKSVSAEPECEKGKIRNASDEKTAPKVQGRRRT